MGCTINQVNEYGHDHGCEFELNCGAQTVTWNCLNLSWQLYWS